MSTAYFLYSLMASVAFPAGVGVAAVRGRLKGHWRERLGFTPPVAMDGKPRIWIHAVSVGEIQAAAALTGALARRCPNLVVWLTTSTSTGREAARWAMPRECPIRTFPLDVFGGPTRALASLKPDIVILLESELWPNFLKAAKARGVKTMLANGRISARSASGYRRVRFFLREVLDNLDLMAMIHPDDRDRIVSIGADPSRVRVAGNAKYDLLLDRVDPDRTEQFRRDLGLVGRPVLVAGSTRQGEEPIILDVFRRLRSEFPGLHLILAPRHVQRAEEIEARIRSLGLTHVRRSRMPSKCQEADVTLVDVMGELFHLYGLAQVAFCGGSLAPRGGQNPLEPAAWGVPVLYGPSMEDFIDARTMLEGCGAGYTVHRPADLYQGLRELLADPDRSKALGFSGRQALERQHGAADNLADLALDLLAMDKHKGV